MKTLEECGWEEGRVPTGRIWSRKEIDGDGDTDTNLIFEDREVSVHPPKGVTSEGWKHCFSKFNKDDIEAILNQFNLMWGYEYKTKTFKEINSKHDMICIEQVKGIKLTSFRKYIEEQKGNEIGGNGKKVFSLWFCLDGMMCFESDNFDTEAEAIEFRDEIMGWGNKE